MASLVVLKRKEDKNADQAKTKNHCDSNPLLLKGILNFVIPASRRSDPSNTGRLPSNSKLIERTRDGKFLEKFAQCGFHGNEAFTRTDRKKAHQAGPRRIYSSFIQSPGHMPQLVAYCCFAVFCSLAHIVCDCGSRLRCGGLCTGCDSVRDIFRLYEERSEPRVEDALAGLLGAQLGYLPTSRFHKSSVEPPIHCNGFSHASRAPSYW
jgi:hypothetical protein